jgi:ribokinase
MDINPSSRHRVAVFGPAYLDRVLRVDRSLIAPSTGGTVDQSVDGRLRFDPTGGLTVVDPAGYRLLVELPDYWPGPTGEVTIDRAICEGMTGERSVEGLAWHDDLGGMGAGFAAALGGELTSALGVDQDPLSEMIERLLASARIAHHAIRIPDREADWTLLISSGEFGDKLPIGFRGCHASLVGELLDEAARRPCDLRVVAALPNAVAARVLSVRDGAIRFFAPTTRNVLDRQCPLPAFADSIDILSCNRREWEALEGREDVAWRVSILMVTNGPEGFTVRFTTPAGEPGHLEHPAFPRARPPLDTNRAGEALASEFLSVLLESGWSPATGVVEPSVIRAAADRAAAAAALVLDRARFGFPGREEIDAALAAGRVV